MRIRNTDDYESHNDSFDEGYDAEGAIFFDYIYKLNTPQFKKVNRNQYGNGCDFKHQIIEYCGKNCYLPLDGY